MVDLPSRLTLLYIYIYIIQILLPVNRPSSSWNINRPSLPLYQDLVMLLTDNRIFLFQGQTLTR